MNLEAIIWFEKQKKKCIINLTRVPQEQRKNIIKKIEYFEAAIEALKKDE